MKRFEDLLDRIFSVTKDDLKKAERIAEEIEEVIERHQGPKQERANERSLFGKTTYFPTSDDVAYRVVT